VWHYCIPMQCRLALRAPGSGILRAAAVRSAITHASSRTWNPIWIRAARVALLGLLLLDAALSRAAEMEHWVTVWAASPAPMHSDALPSIPSVMDQTIRQRMRLSLGGRHLRVRFSNEYGDVPLTLDAASIVQCDTAAAPARTVPLPLTFAGQTSVTVPPGAPMYSDAADLPVAALSHVCISVYLSSLTLLSTVHFEGLDTAIVSESGNFTLSASIPRSATSSNRFFVTAIDAMAPGDARVVVTLGDSITDGDSSDVDGDRRWPDAFAEFAIRHGNRPLAAVNAGISGNRLLRDGASAGSSALARFDRDVLIVPGITDLIVLEGINDIGWPGPFDIAAPPSVGELIRAYKQLIARAHARGIRVYGGTLTPFEGAVYPGYYTASKEAIRAAVNDWIRQSGAYDAVVDFDAIARDPAHPDRLRGEFDSGDHLHLNDAGYAALAREASRIFGMAPPPRACLAQEHSCGID
jgi:lysophospholipase L1-like esterase